LSPTPGDENSASPVALRQRNVFPAATPAKVDPSALTQEILFVFGSVTSEPSEVRWAPIDVGVAGADPTAIAPSRLSAFGLPEIVNDWVEMVVRVGGAASAS
jgi:hypothetical protein